MKQNVFDIQKAFFEDFKKIENSFIGSILSQVNYENYLYKITELKCYYKALSNIDFETPPSRLDWTPVEFNLKNNMKTKYSKFKSVPVSLIFTNSRDLCGND